ncbi:MAG: hypothetical protein IIC15_06005 [Thaumarchaeota archaeon]|nr:hypothetical protein [Nitrososphaerota archaeon]
MNFYTILAILAISTIGIYSGNLAFAQVDPLIDIEFLQTGVLNTSENQFHISNEITIREFFNGKIIRVSGQVIEGFPYITYSKILEDEIDTHGMIFIGGKFVDLNFAEKIIQEKVIIEKNDDLAIVIQYTQRIYSEKFLQIDVKIFEKERNKLNNFYQKDNSISNTNIEIIVINEDGQNVYSSNGITNDRGLYEMEYLIPENSKREILIVTINAENENSKSSKILQVFSLGREPSDGKSS